MQKVNLTVGAFEVPFEVVTKLKSFKRFAAILSDYGHLNLKLIRPEKELSELTETGYYDEVLGLMQDGPDGCFLPLPLDTQEAHGYFTSVILENYFFIMCRNLNDLKSAIISSLTSIEAIPFLLALLSILILELIAVKHYKIGALLTAIFRSFGISFYQHSSHHSSCLCLIQMLILMFPVFIFNSAFSTQTILGTTNHKIDTLQNVIKQGKMPPYMEGISMYDFFKGKVNEGYADVYERSVSAGLGEPFLLGPIADLNKLDNMLTFVSGVDKELALLIDAASNVIKPNQEQYFSSKPFHRSLQTMLSSYNASKAFRKKFETLSRRLIQSGIVTKIEGNIHDDFMPSFYPASLYDFHKSGSPRKGDDLNWKSLNYWRFYRLLYLIIAILTLSIALLLIELVIASLTQTK